MGDNQCLGKFITWMLEGR